MANTSSAKKATRVIARRTAVNKSRRSRLRTTLGNVEEALASGDRAKAAAALLSRTSHYARIAKGRSASQRCQPQSLAARKRLAHLASDRPHHQ
jgi:small subunit ribosomal protein S20